MAANIIFLNNLNKIKYKEEIYYYEEKLEDNEYYEEELNYSISSLNEYLNEEKLTSQEQKSFENYKIENKIEDICNKIFYLEIIKQIKILEIKKLYVFINKVKIMNYLDYNMFEINKIDFKNSFILGKIDKNEYNEYQKQLINNRNYFKNKCIKEVNEYEDLIINNRKQLEEISESYNFVTKRQNNKTIKEEVSMKKVLLFSEFKKKI